MLWPRLVDTVFSSLLQLPPPPKNDRKKVVLFLAFPPHARSLILTLAIAGQKEHQAQRAGPVRLARSGGRRRRRACGKNSAASVTPQRQIYTLQQCALPEPLTLLPSRSAGELNTQFRAKLKGATADKEAATLATDSTDKAKSLGKSLFQNKIKSRLAEVAALGRSSVSDSERAWNSSASETSEKEEHVTILQNIPVQLIRMMPAATVSAATMQRAVSHATISNLTRATASASSRVALSAQRPRSNSMEALLEEVSYKPLQPYSFPTGSIQPSLNGRHDSGDDFPAASHTHLASASGRLDRLRLQVSLARS